MLIADLAANRFWLTGFSLLLLLTLITMSQGVITKQCLCCCTLWALGMSEEVQGLNGECVGRTIFLGAVFSTSPLVKFLSKYNLGLNCSFQGHPTELHGLKSRYFKEMLPVLFPQFGIVLLSYQGRFPLTKTLAKEKPFPSGSQHSVLSITNNNRKEREDGFGPFCLFLLCIYDLQATVLFSSATGSCS